ncbi:MAG: SpoIIIAH-like family protein, partial [Anaerotignum sp.]|nr:SpoIIIAH-like family protein [Anaerotignum sp.]
FSQCIAVISNENCNVIVESDGLAPGEVAQITEIVYEQAGIHPTNLKIVEKNLSET